MSAEAIVVEYGWSLLAEDGPQAPPSPSPSFSSAPPIEIELRPGLDSLTREVWEAVSKRNTPPELFLRGDAPVRIEQYRTSAKGAWEVKLRDTDSATVLHEVSKRVTFVKKGRQGLEVADMPMRLAVNMLRTLPREIPLPTITRVSRAPVVTPSGHIRTTPGYVSEVGVYYADSGLLIPHVSEHPTPEDVQRAVKTITTPLQDFPFVGDADRTHAVALMLLPLVRECIEGPTPLHYIEKPIAGTGATLLFTTALFPAWGDTVATSTAPENDEEWEKKIISLLRNAPTFVALDNVNRLHSASLASALTTTKHSGRILGVSETVEFPVRCTWVANGNNTTRDVDTERRIVRIRLDAKVEKPWEGRTFKIANLTGWSRQHRAQMVHALLTITRAWFADNCPSPKARPLGSFEEWARVIGGILEHVGFQDFLGNREIGDDDPMAAKRWFVTEWFARHKTARVSARDMGWALMPDSPLITALNAKNNTDLALRQAFGAFLSKIRNQTLMICNGKDTMLVRVQRIDVKTGGIAHYQLFVKESDNLFAEGSAA